MSETSIKTKNLREQYVCVYIKNVLGINSY